MPRQQQVNRRNSSKPNLWQSRENLIQEQEPRPEPHGASDRQESPERRPLPRPSSEERHPHYENASAPKDLDVTPTNNNKPTRTPFRITNDNVDSTRVTPIGAAQSSTPVTRYVPTVATTRQPATYQLISAALNTPTHSRSNTDSRKAPVPAQRSSSMVVNRSNLNQNGVMPNRQQNYIPLTRQPNGALPNRPTAGPQHKQPPQQQLPFNKYQQTMPTHNLLYSERRPPVNSNYNPAARDSHYGVYQSMNSVNASRPHPQTQNYVNQPTPVPSARRTLPTYEEARGNRTRSENPYMSHDQINRQSQNSKPIDKPIARDGSNITAKVRPGDNLVVQPVGESCCSSSNPDSGYGGQSGDFYSSHPSPKAATNQTAGNEFDDTWYNRRLQDAARKMNGYSSSHPPRTMTSDV